MTGMTEANGNDEGKADMRCITKGCDCGGVPSESCDCCKMDVHEICWIRVAKLLGFDERPVHCSVYCYADECKAKKKGRWKEEE